MEPYNLPIGIRVSDCTDEQLLSALKWERYQADRPGAGIGEFLANLEAEWQRRNLCSRCLRELDQALAEQVREIDERARNAEDKLGRIRKTLAENPDIISRPQVLRILDEA